LRVRDDKELKSRILRFHMDGHLGVECWGLYAMERKGKARKGVWAALCIVLVLILGIYFSLTNLDCVCGL